MRSGFLILLICPSLLAVQITPGSKQAAQKLGSAQGRDCGSCGGRRTSISAWLVGRDIGYQAVHERSTFLGEGSNDP